jgi:hypothetical protein
MSPDICENADIGGGNNPDVAAKASRSKIQK